MRTHLVIPLNFKQWYIDRCWTILPSGPIYIVHCRSGAFVTARSGGPTAASFTKTQRETSLGIMCRLQFPVSRYLSQPHVFRPHETPRKIKFIFICDFNLLALHNLDKSYHLISKPWTPSFLRMQLYPMIDEEWNLVDQPLFPAFSR